MKIRNKKEKEEYDMKKGIWVTISILSLGVFLALSFFIIAKKEVAEKYNSVFNSTLKYNLESELKMSKVSIKNIVKEPDNEYRVNFHREFEIKFDKNSDTISGGMDDYTAYIVEKNGEFYIDRILNDVDLEQFKNNKSKIAKLFKSEEELFNEAMKSEIEARKNYEEYLKNL